MMQADGTRQKYDGQSWRLACKDIHCKCLAVAHGYCRRHDILTRKKNLNCNSISTDLVLSIVDPTVISIPVSKSSITRSRSSKAAKLKKGDIQLVRQQWNGTKWYSLCHHPSGNCKNRSGGAKCAHLCQVHYRERQEKQQKPNLFHGNEHLSLLERTIRPIGKICKSIVTRFLSFLP